MKKPNTLLHRAQAPLRFAEQCILHGSDTLEGRYARYLAHHDLRVILAEAAGFRKAERPLKLFLYMLERKGIEEPPRSVIQQIFAPSPAEILDRRQGGRYGQKDASSALNRRGSGTRLGNPHRNY